MQKNEKYSEEARTFPEIWESLTPSEREHLRSDLTRRLKVAYCTVWRWQAGNRRPRDFATRKEIARLTSAVIGRKCHPDLLFP